MEEDALLAAGAGFGKGYDVPPTAGERAQVVVGSATKAALQRGLRATLGTAGWFTERGTRRSASGTPRRILIIRTDLLGDLVLTLPAVHALRSAFPDATIDLLVQPSTAGILTGQPGIDHIWHCDPDGWFSQIGHSAIRQKVRRLIQQLRQAEYDLAVSVCGDWASIFARLSSAPRRVGFRDEAFAHFLTDPLPGGRYQTHQHETEYVLQLAAHAGGIVAPPGDPARWPLLHLVPDAQATVAGLLTAVGVRAGQPVIALHAGSRNGQAKRWPLPFWARLADQLIAETDAAILLVGAPGDKPLAQQVMHQIHAQTGAHDLTGRTNLPELAALLAASAVVVTGDSGPLHIGEAVGSRVVAIHGPTDPAQSGPCHPESIIVRHDLWCAPCYNSRATAECRFHNPICMKQLMPHEVLPAVLQQLAGNTPGTAHPPGSP